MYKKIMLFAAIVILMNILVLSYAVGENYIHNFVPVTGFPAGDDYEGTLVRIKTDAIDENPEVFFGDRKAIVKEVKPLLTGDGYGGYMTIGEYVYSYVPKKAKTSKIKIVSNGKTVTVGKGNLKYKKFKILGKPVINDVSYQQTLGGGSLLVEGKHLIESRSPDFKYLKVLLDDKELEVLAFDKKYVLAKYPPEITDPKYVTVITPAGKTKVKFKEEDVEPVNFNIENSYFGGSPKHIALDDFNNDGNIDAAIPAPSKIHTMSIFLGDGEGDFNLSDVILAQRATNTSGFEGPILSADFDKDGNIDIVVQVPALIHLYHGNGDGTFDEPIKNVTSSGYCMLYSGDFNNDGYLDVITSDNDGTVSVFLNDKEGKFLERNYETPEYDYQVGNYGFDSFMTGNVGDFNEDGNMDFAIGESTDSLVYIIFGDGAGKFTDSIALPVGELSEVPWSVETADFNGDGHLDLAVPYTYGLYIKIFIGDGTGNFSEGETYSGGGTPITAEDMDEDGKVDLVFDNSGICVMRGNGDGTFNEPQTRYTPMLSSIVYVTDVNNDGNKDVVSSFNGGWFTISIGDGSGGFLTSGRSHMIGGGVFDLASADYNNDGEDDLFITGVRENKIFVLTNKGGGEFSQSSVISVDGYITWVRTGDFNSDGNMDLVLPVREEEKTAYKIRVLLGDGLGGFETGAETPMPSYVKDAWFMNDIRVADINNDEEEDIVLAFGGGGGNIVVFGVNNGDGSFSFTNKEETGDDPARIAIGDFNQDGNLDYVVTNFAYDYDADTMRLKSGSISILLGDSKGGIKKNRKIKIRNTGPHGVLAMDLNKDGIVDIAMTALESIWVLEGKRKGKFKKPKEYRIKKLPPLHGVLTEFVPYEIGAGDFNGDGRTDLIVSNTGGGSMTGLGLELFIFLGKKHGKFSRSIMLPTGFQPHQMVIKDFNNDNIDDIVNVNHRYSDLTVYLSGQ